VLLYDVDMFSLGGSTTFHLVPPPVLVSIVSRHTEGDEETEALEGHVEDAAFGVLGTLVGWETVGGEDAETLAWSGKACPCRVQPRKEWNEM
jgi:hypothetical protein